VVRCRVNRRSLALARSQLSALVGAQALSALVSAHVLSALVGAHVLSALVGAHVLSRQVHPFRVLPRMPGGRVSAHTRWRGRCACPGVSESACPGESESARPGLSKSARPGLSKSACPGLSKSARPGVSENAPRQPFMPRLGAGEALALLTLTRTSLSRPGLSVKGVSASLSRFEWWRATPPTSETGSRSRSWPARTTRSCADAVATTTDLHPVAPPYVPHPAPVTAAQPLRSHQHRAQEWFGFYGRWHGKAEPLLGPGAGVTGERRRALVLVIAVQGRGTYVRSR
jgi:hypothetical protein